MVERTFDPHATVARGVELARSTYARLDANGDDGLGRAKIVVSGGNGSHFNRLTRTTLVGVGGPKATGPTGHLSVLETTVHELTHKWMDSRAGGIGLIYGGSSGRLSEGLSQVMAGSALILEGTPEEQAHGWRVLDPRTQTTPMKTLLRGKVDVPLSVTMDDVARTGFTFTDNGFVHVHSGVVQEGHRLIARSIGAEQMAQLTVDTARASLTPVTGMRGWASATVAQAQRTFGTGSVQAAAVRDAWATVRLLLPG